MNRTYIDLEHKTIRYTTPEGEENEDWLPCEGTREEVEEMPIERVKGLIELILTYMEKKHEQK